MTSTFPLKAQPVCVRPSALELGERLFCCEVGRDVTLKGTDGSVLAHSVVLSAVSDVFKGMFSSGMLEVRSKEIEVDATAAQLQFLLRLLYTNQLDEEDWKGYPIEKQWYRVTIHGESCDWDWSDDSDDEWIPWWVPGNCYEASGLYHFVKSINRSPIFRNAGRSGLLYHCPGSTIRNNDICPALCNFAAWKITTGWQRTRKAEDDLLPSGRGGEVGWLVGQPSDDTTKPPVRMWTLPDGPHLGLVPEVSTAPPLDFLLVAMRFTRKYIIEFLQGTLDELICERLCPSTFSEILSTAIQIDHTPLRMHCLQYAQGSKEIWGMHERREFFAEVAFELRTLWPQTACRHYMSDSGQAEVLGEDGKRRRYV